MSDKSAITEILIDRDITAFVIGAWDDIAEDFDAEHFTGYSWDGTRVGLSYPTLEHYRNDWLRQAEAFSSMDRIRLRKQLHDVQRLVRIDVDGNRALAVKVFNGTVDGADGPQHLEWTTYYYLSKLAGSWRITGFHGYLPGSDAT